MLLAKGFDMALCEFFDSELFNEVDTETEKKIRFLKN